nr:ATP-binding protein [uncultured Chitinophaga sp.]
MRTTLLFLCCIFSTTVLKAQSPTDKRYLDSLESVFARARTDSEKIRAAVQISSYWVYTDTVKAMAIIDQVAPLAKGKPYYEGLLISVRANASVFVDDFDNGQQRLMAAERIFEKLNTPQAYGQRARLWYNYAFIEQRRGHDKEFLRIILERCIPYGEKSQENGLLSQYYSAVGVAFMNEREYDKAIQYQQKAIDRYKEEGQKDDFIIWNYLRMATCYIYKKELPKAKQNLDIVSTMPESKEERSYTSLYYTTYAQYYGGMKQFDAALEAIDAGMKAAQHLNQGHRYSALLYQKYSLLKDMKRYREAKAILVTLSSDKTFTGHEKNQLTLKKEMAETMASLGDYKGAYEMMVAHKEQNDSVNNQVVRRQVEELEIQYRNAEHEKKIAVLESEKKEAAARARNQALFNWLLSTVALILLILAAFSWLFYRNQKKLSAQEEVNHRQQVKEMQQQQQLVATEAMLEGAERERRRVARELHDGLGGLLSGIRIKLSGVSRSNEELDKIIHQVDNAVSEVRRIAHNMMPETLARFGVETALQELCDSLQTPQTVIHFEAFDIRKEMPVSAQLAIYRIVQEALSNALRYADAKNIVVQCSQNGHTFFITVEDDGKGFDPRRPQRIGIGLASMENRARYLNGKLELDSQPGAGTTIHVELDLETKSKEINTLQEV